MSEERSDTQGAEMPFPPSWIDRFIAWVDRLPGTAWIYYSLSVLALALLANAIFWVDGSMEVGTFDRVNTISAIFIFYWIALYQYLTQVGSRSLKTFRPLLEVDETECARIEYELGTLPRCQGWLAILVGLGFSALSILGDPAPYGEISPRTALPYVLDIPVTGFMVATFYGLIIRSIRQLRMVDKLHSRAAKINLLKLEPAHAFSTLTARTGIGVILLLVFAYAVAPEEFNTLLDIILFLLTILIAIAIFVMPLLGMRDRLDKEKECALHQASDMLQVAIDSLHGKVEERGFDDVAGMENAINALIREREMLKKIPTWPWDPRTIRSFGSAMLLPIAIWLVTRLLERFF